MKHRHAAQQPPGGGGRGFAALTSRHTGKRCCSCPGHPALAARSPCPEQRSDYPGGQEDWYLLRFDRCSKCSLSGDGTIDGAARKWVLGGAPNATVDAAEDAAAATSAGFAASEGSTGTRALLATQHEQPALSLVQEAAEGGEPGGLDERDPPTKAVRNWDDPSCTDPRQCRCARWVGAGQGRAARACASNKQGVRVPQGSAAALRATVLRPAPCTHAPPAC